MSSVKFVLMRPRNSENLGACARALKNFGFADWAWVEPHAGDNEASRKLAVHAQELLTRATVHPTLASAVGGAAWVVGTSSRRVHGKRSISAREFAALAVERAAHGEVALVLGDERSGLTNEDLAQCHDLSTIPTDDAQPSVNLAQAVLLYAYELHMAALSCASTPPAPRPAPASHSELKGLAAALKEALGAAGFLRDGRTAALEALMAPWVRARLSRHEARLWRAALQVVARSSFNSRA